MEQDPSTGTRVDRGATVQLTVAKARPEVPDVTRLDGGGGDGGARAGRLQGADARPRRTRRRSGVVVDQDPDPGTPRSSGATVTIFVGTDAERGHADPDPDAHAVKVAVLAGGRSSEHDVSLNSAAAVRAGVAAAGHEVLPVTIERGGAWVHDGADAVAGARAAGCSAPTPSSRSCTGRSARTGRSRGCSSCSTCPTSARACSPPRCAWTRWSSRRCWPPPGVPQVPYAGVRLARWRARARGRPPRAGRARHAGLRQARAARAPRSGSRRSARRPSWPTALDAAFAHDSLVIVEGFSAGHGGRVLRARQRRARGLGPGRDRPQGRRLVRLRGQVHARAGWSSSSRRGSTEAVREDVRRLAVRHVPARRLRRPGARGLLRRGRRARAGQRAQHAAGLHGDERLPEALGGVRAGLPGAVRPAARASRSSASRPSAPSSSSP